jgi:DNA-binding MarR family transcriptional regulator
MSERLTTSESNLGYLFRLAHQQFRAQLEDALEDLGLTAQEYGTLSLFESRRELSTADLARLAQVTRQTMHATVLSLEEAGLVERQAVNQRVVLVRPTAFGRRRLAAATRRVRAVESAALTGLDARDELVVRGWLAALAAGAPMAAAGHREQA